jgi:hypothetical protein
MSLLEESVVIELKEGCQYSSTVCDSHVILSVGSLDWRLARNEINHTKELDAGLMSELPSYRSVAAVESDSFSLQGSATIHTASCGSSFVASKECIQLTPALTSQTGSAFVRSKVSLERHEGIVVDFAFKIANENDGKADGADGLAFVIQSFAENALGSGRPIIVELAVLQYIALLNNSLRWM